LVHVPITDSESSEPIMLVHLGEDTLSAAAISLRQTIAGMEINV
jgi:hypothetical protein